LLSLSLSRAEMRPTSQSSWRFTYAYHSIAANTTHAAPLYTTADPNTSVITPARNTLKLGSKCRRKWQAEISNCVDLPMDLGYLLHWDLGYLLHWDPPHPDDPS
jgi:hypothetical protein